MSMPVELPDEVARRVLSVAARRGVQPEQVVIEAVTAQLGAGGVGEADDPFASIRDELRMIVFDGSLRSEVDRAIDDPDLAVGRRPVFLHAPSC